MVLLIVIGTGSVIPAAISQGQNLSQAIPDLPNRLPAAIDNLQQLLAGFGITVDLRGLYQSNLEPQLNQIGVGAMRELINGLSVVAATVSNLLLVLILSLYMSLGGRELAEKFVELIPRHYNRELMIFAGSVNKNFGGFIRGQLIQSLLVGIATAVVMIVMGLNFVVLAAILSALVMLLPLIGVFLAILPPVLVALFAGSLPTAVIVFVLLFVFQQVMMNAHHAEDPGRLGGAAPAARLRRAVDRRAGRRHLGRVLRDPGRGRAVCAAHLLRRAHASRGRGAQGGRGGGEESGRAERGCAAALS